MTEALDFLDLGDLSEVQELQTVPEGEYTLRIIALELRKKNNAYLFAKFAIEGESGTKPVQHTFMLPKPDDDPDTADRRKRSIKHFYQAFGIPLTGPVYFSEYIGATGRALLSEEEDPEFGAQNRIRKFIV